VINDKNLLNRVIRNNQTIYLWETLNVLVEGYKIFSTPVEKSVDK